MKTDRNRKKTKGKQKKTNVKQNKKVKPVKIVKRKSKIRDQKSVRKTVKGKQSEKKTEGNKGNFFDNIVNKVKGIYAFFVEKIRTDKRYRYTWKGINILLFLIGLYLVLYPFIPAILYKLFYEGREIYPYETKLEDSTEGEFGGKEVPDEDRLVIPSIGVDMPIVEGNNDSVLNLGVWRRPGTGEPGNGNMVLTGHRVGYAFLPEDIRNSTSFYNLDKLEIDDYVIVYWEGKEYDYKVYDWEIVDKTQVSIESQDVGERLTLYTCHPVGQNDKRLVYYARRIEE